MLMDLVDNKSEHIKICLKHLSKEQHKQIILIMDNADQRTHDVQQEIFLISEEVANSWSSTVFVTLRPETFNMSKQKGALSGYHAKAFTISPPRIDKVIEKRLNYALKFTSGELQPKALVKNTSFNSVSLDKLIKVFLYTLSEKEEIIEFLDNITAGNVREALDIVRLFFGSGHVNTGKIIDIYDKTGLYTIAFHEFLRAVIYGDTHYYAPDHSIIVNLFDISSFDSKEHFLLPLILGLLSSLPSPHLDSGFVSTETLYEHTQSLGYLPEQIDKALIRAINKKLIETNARMNFDADFTPTTYRITTKGAYHFTMLCKEFAYKDSIIVDTPILNDTFQQLITDVHEIDERIIRVQYFKSYLDQCWDFANFSNTTFDWKQISTDLNTSINRVSFRVNRRRELSLNNNLQ